MELKQQEDESNTGPGTGYTTNSLLHQIGQHTIEDLIQNGERFATEADLGRYIVRKQNEFQLKLEKPKDSKGNGKAIKSNTSRYA